MNKESIIADQEILFCHARDGLSQLAAWLHISQQLVWRPNLNYVPCTQMAYGERSGDIRYGAFQTNPIIR